MIIELLCSPIFLLINGLISLLPSNYELPNYVSNVISLISKAGEFFPLDMFFVVIGNIAFWVGVHLLWVVIEWVYKKIPRCRLIEFRVVILKFCFIYSFNE